MGLYFVHYDAIDNTETVGTGNLVVSHPTPLTLIDADGLNKEATRLAGDIARSESGRQVKAIVTTINKLD